MPPGQSHLCQACPMGAVVQLMSSSLQGGRCQIVMHAISVLLLTEAVLHVSHMRHAHMNSGTKLPWGCCALRTFHDCVLSQSAAASCCQATRGCLLHKHFRAWVLALCAVHLNCGSHFLTFWFYCRTSRHPCLSTSHPAHPKAAAALLMCPPHACLQHKHG